jgi:hypothetical protein
MLYLDQSEALSQLAIKAGHYGCDVVVQVGSEAATIGLVKLDGTAREARETYDAMNSYEGIQWLMMKLTGY